MLQACCQSQKACGTCPWKEFLDLFKNMSVKLSKYLININLCQWKGYKVMCGLSVIVKITIAKVMLATSLANVSKKHNKVMNKMKVKSFNFFNVIK